jgi:hypothetical protein
MVLGRSRQKERRDVHTSQRAENGDARQYLLKKAVAAPRVGEERETHVASEAWRHEHNLGGEVRPTQLAYYAGAPYNMSI